MAFAHASVRCPDHPQVSPRESLQLCLRRIGVATRRHPAPPDQAWPAPRQRHRRKYTDGKLPPDQSFYFTGQDYQLHLRTYNLSLFMDLADGVDEDDATWLHHLRYGPPA
jgi:hypothetical protein